MNVAVVGPFSRGISFEVHHSDCADLNKARNKRHDPWHFNAASFQEIVENTYGDHFGDHEEGSSGASWVGYVQEFRVMACVENLGGILPERTPVAKPRRCYTIAELIERIAAIDPLCEPGSPEWREQTTLIRMLNAAEQYEAAH